MASHLAENVMHFARVLRAAGLPIGTDRVRLALEALPIAGLASRDDFRATLAACLVDRREHVALFEQAFHVFWRDPDLLGRMLAMLLPRVEGRARGARSGENRRLAEALVAPKRNRVDVPAREELRFDATLTFSDRERLAKADFESMSATEWDEARRVVARLALRIEPVATRRTKASSRGRVDWRRTLRAAARGAGPTLRHREPARRAPPLVVIADISGSMSRYSRMLLHFAHALVTQNRAGATRVEAFVFGTRLSSITRALAARDPDAAVAAVVRKVDDWSGGTRIAECLTAFNRDWSRRVLAQNATVLLVTDGLEHGDTARLAFETERLGKSCRRLVWLNPLLRYRDFEPRAAGVRAMLPHVDRFVPAHNLESLSALAAALDGARSFESLSRH